MSQAQVLTSPSISLVNDRPATTSLAIAESFGKRHDHVVRTIQDLIHKLPESFSAPNFGAAEYMDEQGKPRPMFTVFFDGFILLVMGYTGKKALGMKLAYIEAFNAMREKLEHAKTEPASNPDKLPAVSLSVTPSTVADRKPLRSLVNAWARVSGHPFDACWSQLKAAFSLTDIRDLPQEWIPDAVAWVQAKIDAQPTALPATPVAPSAPAVVEDRRIPDALAEMRKLISHCGMVRNTVQVECHPGVVSMSMSAQEREAYYALQAMYQTAVDNMYTAAHALDACLKLRAMYPAHR